MRLTAEEQAMLAGEAGPATQLAMKLVVSLAEAEDASALVEIESAHIDGCLYHGQSGVDFAVTLSERGGEVRVPTTLNVTSLDMLHPELFRGDPEVARASNLMTDAYVAMGCSPTWTCAPYQLTERPGFGQQIAWGESNAIVFANSVIGARTNRYGDFIDICCAITARAPYTGLHKDEGRLAGMVIEVDVPDRILASEVFYPVLGYAIGRLSGDRVPAIVGLGGEATEDRLRALGAAAASSGALGMFHAVGVTPEAPDLTAALGGKEPPERVHLQLSDLTRVRRELNTPADTIGAVSVGTPHMSLEELHELASLTEGLSSRIPFYVNTGRDVLARAESEGISRKLEDFGVTLVTDTCTYITPIMSEVTGAVMTNSGKWAHYAPANLGVEVLFGSLTECVRSAVAGQPEISSDWL